MVLFTNREDTSRTTTVSPGFSHGLEWIWQHLVNVRHPYVLECGRIRQSTLDVMRARGATIYVADLITPALDNASTFWSHEGKKSVFLTDDFLAQLPQIPAGSLAVVCCWGLLDLLPREAVPTVLERLYSYLQAGGILFCFLREPSLAAGADARWWFEGPTVLGSDDRKAKTYPYPAVTNREMERLFPGGNIKTFLTRSGRRECLGLK